MIRGLGLTQHALQLFHLLSSVQFRSRQTREVSTSLKKKKARSNRSVRAGSLLELIRIIRRHAAQSPVPCAGNARLELGKLAKLKFEKMHAQDACTGFLRLDLVGGGSASLTRSLCAPSGTPASPCSPGNVAGCARRCEPQWRSEPLASAAQTRTLGAPVSPSAAPTRWRARGRPGAPTAHRLPRARAHASSLSGSAVGPGSERQTGAAEGGWEGERGRKVNFKRVIGWESSSHAPAAGCS